MPLQYGINASNTPEGHGIDRVEIVDLEEVVEGLVGASGQTGAIQFIIDGAGSAITTGVKGDIEVPFACTLTGWTLLADQSGSIVIDVWRDSYANYPPTAADSISTSKPTLSSAIKNQDLTITDWTEAIPANSILRFNVDSAATLTRVTLSLLFTKD